MKDLNDDVITAMEFLRQLSYNNEKWTKSLDDFDPEIWKNVSKSPDLEDVDDTVDETVDFIESINTFEYDDGFGANESVIVAVDSGIVADSALDSQRFCVPLLGKQSSADSQQTQKKVRSKKESVMPNLQCHYLM